MEPVTHLLTGACLSRTGLNRRAAYATLTMVVAAEMPDLDTLWSLRGPVEGFQHHRGITHTLTGLPFEAAILVAAIYGLHRWRVARASKSAPPPDPSRIPKPLTNAPVRWGMLYALALLALLSHLLLDYTNNYGIRPFFPFIDRWYAASIVFIVDPAILCFLLAGLLAPVLFGLVGSEVGARRPVFRGRGWARAALLGIAALWTLRAVQHGRAITIAMAQNVALPTPVNPETSASADAPPQPDPPPTYVDAQRALATPDPLNPFHWSTVTDLGPMYQLAEVDTLNKTLTEAQTPFPKIPADAAILAAENSRLGRAYLDWSPMPILEVTRPTNALEAEADGDPDAAGLTVVTFRDPRFMGGWLSSTGRSPLSGTVTIDTVGRVVRQTMDGRVQR